MTASPSRTPSPTSTNKNKSVVTRFAPSPTGYLHIGGARTALFNWLFARHHEGKFLLRIEDTDRARHSEDAVKAIIEGLNWMGIPSDEPHVSQYEQRHRHVEIAQALLASGHAYQCYLSAEELEQRREKAMENKTRFESPWRDRSADDHLKETPFTIRLRTPQSGQTTIQDAVQGEVTIPNSALDDLIILRSKTGTLSDEKDAGSATYNLAVVVDDHDMGVTHIIRGDDHLINAARQYHIYQAMGWPVPVFAHIPLIHGPDGKKLSKRHGALGIEAYRDMGYLADGLSNYLLRLGWAHGDEEIIPVERAIELFTLKGINKSPARLDLEKLDHINSIYLRTLSDEEFAKAAMPFLIKDRQPLTDDETARILRGASALKERCAHFGDVPAAAEFLLAKTPFDITGKAAKPLKKPEAAEHLRAIDNMLEAHEDWSSEDILNEALEDLAKAREVGFGQVGPPLRAALTSGLASPSLGAILYALGPEETRLRLSQCLANWG